MLLSNLSTDLPLLWPSGMTLSLEEKMNIELSLLKIYEHEDFEEVLFWGKIRGIMKDYYIAMALNYKSFKEYPSKRFFWCTNQNWSFAELSPLLDSDKEFVEQFNMNFTGEHDRILLEAAENVTETEDLLVPDEQEKLPSKNFTELDRLSYVVRSICHDCQIVPVGAFRMTPGYELIRNKNFEGLSMTQLKDIKNYGHFRQVESSEKREMIDRGDALSCNDFFDCIEKDIPNGCWSFISDSSGVLISVRNLLWPGYSAYHKANTKSFGGVYIGDGIRNSDLPFMI